MTLLELFKKSGRHVAFVVDEYGDVQGLVTINDVLESIVGDIPSGHSRRVRERGGTDIHQIH